MGFVWSPGDGPDPASLAALHDLSPKPAAPMGEAWFMGQTRRMFTELEGDIASVDVRLLKRALAEISSGLSSFGRLEEWNAWCSYLLPHVIPRCCERYVHWLIEDVVTAVLQCDLGRADDPDLAAYRRHVLQTLGQSLMAAERWQDGQILLGRILHPSNHNPARIWGWGNVSGDLAASIILCLRLIEETDIDGWVASFFAITCPYWRAQILTWYVGAGQLLRGEILFPTQFSAQSPTIDWSWSHVISGQHEGAVVATSLFPKGNLPAFKSAFENQLRMIDLDQWRNDIRAIDPLSAEAGQIIAGVKTP